MSSDPRPILVEICHLLASRNFTTATGGNVSVRLPDGTFWVTPTSLHKSRVQLADLVRVDADCRIVEGTRKPSSETMMHLAVYRALPQAGAVVHAHPPTATGFAQACRPIDNSSSSEGYVILGPEVPLIPYMRPSTAQFAETVAAALRPLNQAYLLANHGVLTWGCDLWNSYDILDTLEFCAQSLLAAITLGGPQPLPPEELAWLEEKAARR